MTQPDVVEHCVTFCRTLRERGVPVTPAETLLGVRTLGLVDIGDREDVRLGLRTALVLRRDQYALFDAVFDEMWGGDSLAAGAQAGTPAKSRVTSPPPNQQRAQVTLDTWMRGEDPTREERVPLRHASDREALGGRNFSSFNNEQAEAFERLARRIARRLALRRSRRWRAARRGTRLDLRRTIRGSIRMGGEVVALEWRRRKIRRTRLVAICDVSGSMELYARFLLQFLHA
ncbi:MAG: VWA domain-containing protein, partial [Gemmatimonadaceae bacterium]